MRGGSEGLLGGGRFGKESSGGDDGGDDDRRAVGVGERSSSQCGYGPRGSQATLLM